MLEGVKDPGRKGLAVSLAMIGTTLIALAFRQDPAPIAQPVGMDATSVEVCLPAAVEGGRAMAFTTPIGRCLPASALQSYRCGDLEVEVITQGDRRWLGGPYAVAVSELPQQARLHARSQDATSVFVVPGEPQWLYVKRNGSIERWLELPTAPRPASALFIGDSITDGGAPALTERLAGWTVTFDAVVGRPSSGGITPAADASISYAVPSVVIVELGTNDADPVAFASNMEQILTSLEGFPLVVWQTVHSPSTVAAAINTEGRKLVARYPNTVIADWETFAPAGALTSDGVHPAPGHEALMAKLYEPLLRNWADAIAGLGPAACLP